MEKSGTFLAILVLNVCILLILGSTVIYHLVTAPPPTRPTAPPHFKPIAKITPPPPPGRGGDPDKSPIDPPPIDIPPPVVPPKILVSNNSNTTFKIKTSPDLDPNSPLPSLPLPDRQTDGMNHGTNGDSVPQLSPFDNGGGPPALVGYFYDLKQTSDNPPMPTGMTRALWKHEMDRLVADNLNEADLSKYLKSSEPRSTNGFSIPEQDSKNAPVAFGLGNVQPNLWAIVYRAKVSVPEAGRYRFVGFGDDIFFIRVNGKVVFDGGWQTLSEDRTLHERYPLKWSASIGGDAGLLRKGAWFSAEKGDLANLEILIGDWGGKCGFYLMLEKEGTPYEMSSDNTTPKLPLFQVGSGLAFPAPGPEVPPLSNNAVVWPAVSDQL